MPSKPKSPSRSVITEQYELYLGDCTDLLGTTIVGGDVALLDPPYNVGFDYGKETDDNKSPKEFRDWVRRWFAPLRRACPSVMISTGQKRLPDYAKIEPWRWLLAWWKPAAMGRSPVGFCNWEPVALWGKGGKSGVDFVKASIEPSKELNGHPCPKPVGWATGFLGLFPDAETVLDPFMGTATTGVACIRLGKKFIGCEIHEPYFELSVKRIEAAAKKVKFFDVPAKLSLSKVWKGK